MQPIPPLKKIDKVKEEATAFIDFKSLHKTREEDNNNIDIKDATMSTNTLIFTPRYVETEFRERYVDDVDVDDVSTSGFVFVDCKE